MIQAFTRIHRGTLAFALACPLLFLVPVIAELVQHVAEAHIGFFASPEQAKAVQYSPIRMGFGTIKLLTIILAGYWAMRWYAWGDGARAGRFEAVAVRGFAPIFIFYAVVTLPVIWLPVLIPDLPRAFMAISLPFWVIEILFADWRAKAPLGEPSGPLPSIRRVWPVLLWGMGLQILAPLPGMIVHYAFNYSAMHATGIVQIALLCADTLVTGFLAVLMVGVAYEIAMRAISADRGPSSSANSASAT